MEDCVLKKVGVVKCSQDTPQFGGWRNFESEIHIDPAYIEGLEGIESYSHLLVVFWMNRVDKVKLTMRPQGKPEVPTVGIFACRCPSRPTPIAITTCRLLKREGDILRVEGLDAVDGSPVLDIKPYWPQYDHVEAPEYPAWVEKLEF